MFFHFAFMVTMELYIQKKVCGVHRWDMEMIAIREHSFTKPQGSVREVLGLDFMVLHTFKCSRHKS